MYYRVAIQVKAQPPWKWQSTALRSLNSLLVGPLMREKEED